MQSRWRWSACSCSSLDNMLLLPNRNAIRVCLSVFPRACLASAPVKLAVGLVSWSGPYQSLLISTV